MLVLVLGHVLRVVDVVVVVVMVVIVIVVVVRSLSSSSSGWSWLWSWHLWWHPSSQALHRQGASKAKKAMHD
eukprot:CAMPEP_0183415958 /NCGR_PEP_ID=MMETSP0370-20130417/23449_1 /TAXON_ID=268820 /ORGANISM="Peridinium aciculiferum, Strain PAER-2" /LENGTH=71 /DNA_ID=CAMNT_0025599431 /DNA_START=91 /DNA_END=303 /DNA_ORIENTATION=+